MRILIKGGVWKNTEDEILKAAVMKYGKNQWARVASLLSRKSARQCKARWYEWLDPSIKKIEWSKDEEEKLLHLAKLMPNQWRTIAPIVGRTAGQCMEQYEKLLDQAQEGASGDVDDPRRLRPGEIDPAPETKPARPDPIDMDEDEKEMLSEARARLANTKGKKAKRKARERQLDDSRRLSMLQKRRELKAAGIESKLGGGKKRKYIDYAREIPFQKVPPAGFYDAGEENEIGKKMTIDPVKDGLELSRLEGRHERQEEEREKEKDKKRLKNLFKMNAPQAVMAVSSSNDPTTLRKRSSLSLPSPQVSEGELEDIVKMGQNALMPPPDGLPSTATQALIGDYSNSAFRPSQTPLRTPLQENIILQEAKNLRMLRDMTPFSGEEMPELLEGTGFEGVNPRNAKLATPNTILGMNTPLIGSSGSSVQNTPRIGGSVNATPLLIERTPLRDQFGLNDSDAYSTMSDTISTSSRLDKQREREQKASLAAKLRGLPEPEFTYEVSIPQLEGDEKGGKEAEGVYIEDAADVAERQRELIQEEEVAEEMRRSAVIRRGLPRPPTVSQELVVPSKSGEFALASGLINTEMVRLLSYDEYNFPVPAAVASTKLKGGKSTPSKRPRPVELDELADEELQRARELIDLEVQSQQQAEKDIDSQLELSEFTLKLEDAMKSILYLPTRNKGRGTFAPSSTATKPELLSALGLQFEALKSKIDKDSKRATKAEQKVQILTQGYVTRSELLEKAVYSAYEQLDSDSIRLACFKTLAVAEEAALHRRLLRARQEQLEAEEMEMKCHLRYKELKEEYNRVKDLLVVKEGASQEA